MLLALVACTGNEGDDYYVEPGNGGGTFDNSTGMSPTDGGTGDGATLQARVCGLSQILMWDDCDSIGLDGLLVEVGTAQATTRGDGTFDIANPTGSNLVWRVSGSPQMPTIHEYPGDEQRIPSIRLALYQNLAADSNVVPAGGAIFVRVMHMNAPVTDATGSLTGLQELVHYDDAAAPGKFGVDATNAAGIVWFPNVTPGNAVTFTITPPQSVGAPKNTTVRVEAESATFATVVF